MIDLENIEAAARRLAPHIRQTPIVAYTPNGFSRPLFLKLEQLQVTGSFKARGACNRIFAASPESLSTGVVTASGGNHGLGVAYAASRRQVSAIVYLPERAPRSSERRLAALGATCVRKGAEWDDAWAAAVSDAKQRGALLVHPFEDEEVILGQATIGLELVQALPGLDLVVVAIGGGGLAAGVACAVKALRPVARIIGVEPEGAPSMARSLEAGRVVTLSKVDTIAGTLAPRSVGPTTLALVSRHLEKIVLVSDEEMRAAMRTLWEELRLLVEPAGAAALAAVLSGRVSLEGSQTPAVLLCGGNLDLAAVSDFIA
jgi:threonine dehydratase